MKKLVQATMMILALNSVCAYADIPVLSVDENGNENATSISEADYQQVMAAQGAASATVAEDHLMAAAASPNLSLKAIMVGLEAAGNVGVGVWKVGLALNQQFYFEIQK